MPKNVGISMIVCITGKSGSGKTEVIKTLKNRGFITLIMDEYIHEIYQKNNIGYKLIFQNFGKSFINKKEVDRKKLGKYVFSNEKALNLLNEIMIPVMQDKIEEMRKLYPLSFVELAVYINHVPLFEKYFDKVILVEASKNIEKNNLIKKNKSIKKFPTNYVGKLKNPIKNHKINFDILLQNISNLKDLKNKVKLITKNF
jgi:dephospho-CoA kinase